MMDIDTLIAELLADATNRELDAGYGGRNDDGGAREIRAQVDAYRAGQRGVVPDAWKNFANNLTEKEKEERAEFERLKRKYG